MPLPRLLLPLAMITLLAGCQLYLIGTDDDHESTRDVTLDIVGTRDGVFELVELWSTGVVFERESGGRTTFEFEGRPLDLLGSTDGDRVVSRVSLPSGNYDFIQLLAEGSEALNLSVVDDGRGLLDLVIPGDSIGIEVSPSISGGGRWTIVIHTASAVVPDGDFLYRYRQAPKSAYALRNSRAGRITGTIPYSVCSQGAGAGNVAVYIHEESATAPTDIRGRSGVDEPVVSFAAIQAGSGVEWEFVSPLLPEGDWLASYTCRALSDDPERTDDGENGTADITGDLQANARNVEVRAEQHVTVSF